MKKWKGFIVISALLLGPLCFGGAALAQEPDAPAEAPEDDAPAMPGEPKERNFGLYLSVGAGIISADDLNTSINTDVTLTSSSFVRLDDNQLGHAAVGWQLPEGRGDFRLVFNGYKEDEYRFGAIGSAAALQDDELNPESDVNYPWWVMEASGGNFTATRTPPEWTLADDANDNGQPDIDEIRAAPCPSDPLCNVVSRSVPKSLENQIQTLDALYGREFGGRRFSSRWWAGLRYFKYEGQMLAGAWLHPTRSSTGVGYTDGGLLRPLNLYQQASGFGPSGSWEADFNFYNKGVVLFVRGSSAFTFNSIEVDSGEFFTVVDNTAASPPLSVLAPARLKETRDKSSWNNSAEGGVRVNLKNGLQIEASYGIMGFLDVVLLPLEITIPGNVDQAPAGTSALYGSQDFRMDGWRAGVAYQF